MEDIHFYDEGINMSPNYIKIFEGHYNDYDYVSNTDLDICFGYIKQLRYFKNKNKSFNLKLAKVFVRTKKYDLIKYNEFLIEVAKKWFITHMRNFEKEIPNFIAEKNKEKLIYVDLAEKESRYAKYVEKIDQQISFLFNVSTDFNKYSNNIIKLLFSSSGIKYLTNEIFFESLFENISYLSNDIFTKPNGVREICPPEIKIWIKDFIKEIPNNKKLVDGEDFLERIINREIYKSKISEAEILYLLDLIKDNNEVYINTITNNNFVKLELLNYENILNNTLNHYALNKVFKTIKKIKSPTKHMLNLADKLEKEIGKKILVENDLEKEHRNVLKFTIGVGKINTLNNEDAMRFKLFMNNLNKHPNKLEKLGIIELNVIGRINKIDVYIQYKNENLVSLNEDYYKVLLSEIIRQKENIKFNNYNKIYDELLQLRMNYMISLNTKKIDVSIEKPKRKI